ncbi:MAG: protein kinase [Planctomycetota bacterium]
MGHELPGWEVGAAVDGYLLEGELGRGGMGVVYRARHLATDTPCAIKTLLHDASQKAAARFQREALAQARVDRHPHVARVHASGHAFGRAYMVLDLVPGGDLKDKIRGAGALPPEEAARIAAEVGRGLVHAHHHGVLHRDLKPANVLFDELGHARLVDFGIARVQGEEQGLTRTGEMVGTPAYMAPEQLDDARGVDERADVYGLGALLFEALTGETPFTGSGPELFRKVFTVAPPAPSSLRPEIPPPLDDIVLKALAKEPNDRFPGCAAMVEALERFLAGDDPGRAGLRRWKALLAASLLAVLLAAGALAAAHLREPPAETTTAASPGLGDTPEDDPAPRRRARATRPVWALAAGQRLHVAVTRSEVNGSGFGVEVKAELDLEVRAREGDLCRLASTYVVTEFWGGKPGEKAIGVPFEREVLASVRGVAGLTFLLDLSTGRVRDVSGMNTLFEVIRPKLPDLTAMQAQFGVGERDQSENARLLGALYSDETIGAALGAICSAGDPELDWRPAPEQEGAWKLFLRNAQGPRLRSVTESIYPAKTLFHYTGRVQFEQGLPRAVDILQEWGPVARTRLQWSFSRS